MFLEKTNEVNHRESNHQSPERPATRVHKNLLAGTSVTNPFFHRWVQARKPKKTDKQVKKERKK